MKEQRNDWRKNNAQMVASNDGKCYLNLHND